MTAVPQPHISALPLLVVQTDPVDNKLDKYTDMYLLYYIMYP